MGSQYKMFRYTVGSQVGSPITLVKIAMCETYGPILEVCFPHIQFKWSFLEKGYGECKVILRALDKKHLTDLLELFNRSVLLLPNENLKNEFNGEIEHCYALDYNFEKDLSSDGWKYTTIGAIEHSAKENDDPDALAKLVDLLARFIGTHPIYGKADLLIPVPGNPSKGVHFPDNLVRRLSEVTGLNNGQGAIKKKCDTRRAQDTSLADKLAVIEPALISTHNLAGRNVIIVDDLYQSGTTMWAVARCAKNAGAEHVLGLVCVKSLRATDNL